MDEKAEVRNGVEAIALAERANNLTEGKTTFVLDTLAMAYAEAGRFNAAVRIEQELVNLATAEGDTNSIAGLRERLQLYQSNRPWREMFTRSSQK